MTTASPVIMGVDGTGLLVRSSKAARYTGMSAPDGTPTGALTLFIGSLALLVRKVQPDYLIVAWDGEDALRWRRRIYPEYKSNRPAAWSPGWEESRQAAEFCAAAGMTQWSLPGFEADDILAALYRLSWRDLPDCEEVILCSDDHDILQLIEPGRVRVRTFGRDGAVIDAQAVLTEWGVYPENLPRLRALAGDAVDGIPGLPGVGPVRALQMLWKAKFCWPLPEEVLPDPAAYSQALAWHDVMTLRGAPEVPEQHDPTGILDMQKTAWTRGNILPVLEKYGMRSLAERWQKGSLW